MLHTLLYFLALLSLSTSANWAKLNHMPVEVLGFWRLAIASLLLLIWIFIRKHTWPALRNKNIGWVFASGFFFFLHLWTYKYAAKNTSVSNTVILFASNPVWASLGAIAFFREKLSPRVIFSYLLALAGILVLLQGQIQFQQDQIKGDVSALVSALFYAAYMLTSKRARLHYDNAIFSFFQYFVCALCFGLCVLITQTSPIGYDSVSWIAVFGLVLFPTLLGHLLLTYLVHFMNITVLSCGKLLEPVIAAIIAYFVFNEALRTEAWLAFGLTALAVLILFAPGLKRRFQKV